MIPKVLHYIWLGGKELPELEKKCIDSWKATNPDFEVIFWNEDNLGIDDPIYASAYKKKEWAYCSDYARMKVIFEHGGIYLDTDMELIKPLDNLLSQECFIGKENESYINAAIFGAVKGNAYIGDVFSEIREALKTDFVPIPRILTSIYDKNKYQGVSIYPHDYFYPYNPFGSEVKELFYSDISESTYGIHHWKYSWKSSVVKRAMRKMKRMLTKSKYFK